MTRLFEATCVGGIVMVDGLPIPDAVILTQGTAASEGMLVLNKGIAYYVTSNTEDIEDLLTKLVSTLGTVTSVLNTIAATFTSVGAGMTGPTTAPPPTLVTDVASIITAATNITTKATEFTAMKELLK